ncbi:MAG: hypothetical protein V4618_00920 [Pseudomonadota bacterium]
MPGYLAIGIDRYVQTYPGFVFHGVDLTGWGLLMQVRLYADAPGAPMREFAAGGGLSLESVVVAGGVPISTVRLGVPAAIFPYGTDRSADLALSYDLLLKRPDASDWERWLFGPFTILAGVTQHG